VIIFLTYTFLAIFSAGAMLTLQVQHFALYPLVGRGGFAVYIQAKNRAAVFPAILAAVLVFFLSVVLLFDRPGFVPTWAAPVAVVFNVVNIVSTMIWQGRYMASSPRPATTNRMSGC